MFSKRAFLSVLMLGVLLLSACGNVTSNGKVTVDDKSYEYNFTMNEVTPAVTEASQAPATANTATPMVAAPASPQAPAASEASTPVPASRIFVWGYGRNDKAVLEAVQGCQSCDLVFLNSLDDLPEGAHYTFNVASPSANLKDACRTGKEMKDLGVTYALINDFTPCH